MKAEKRQKLSRIKSATKIERLTNLVFLTIPIKVVLRDDDLRYFLKMKRQESFAKAFVHALEYEATHNLLNRLT